MVCATTSRVIEFFLCPRLGEKWKCVGILIIEYILGSFILVLLICFINLLLY